MKQLYIDFTFFLMLSLAVSSCKHPDKNYSANDIIFKDLDTTVKPGTDFFEYANGGWLKKNPIPAAYASWGIGNVVEEELRNRLKKINLDAEKANAPKGSDTQKIGDFYYSGMDTADIERQGLNTLKPELAKIEAIKDIRGLVGEFAHLATIGVTSPLRQVPGRMLRTVIRYCFNCTRAASGCQTAIIILILMSTALPYVPIIKINIFLCYSGYPGWIRRLLQMRLNKPMLWKNF